MTATMAISQPTGSSLRGQRTGAVAAADSEHGANPPLLAALLEAMLREDALGLRTSATSARREDLDEDAWLHLPTPDGTGLLVPVCTGTLLADHAVRSATVRRADTLMPLNDVDEVLALLTPATDPEARAGLTALRQECAEALTAEDLAADARPALLHRLGADVTAPGLCGALALDALAAGRRHPMYPTSAARKGLTAADLADYAPETAPRFALHWAALPLNALTCDGILPTGWPTCADLGLDPSYDDTHLPLPVHPLTAAGPLLDAIDRHGLTTSAVLAPRALIDVIPTLSMRTVALAEQPDLHIKLPLATSTLGRLNRRTLSHGSLLDGATVQALLEELVAADPALRGRVLHADESTFLHTGSDLLGAMVRRWPAGLEDTRLIPVAALAARLGDGRTVAQQTADTFFGGDLTALMESYLRLLVEVHVRLWLVHGVALEAHQQNTALVIDEVAGTPRIRLLFKDNDGPRIDRELLAASRASAAEPVFQDDRLWAREPRELCDVVTTITLHLCAASVVVHLGDDATREHLFGVLRDELTRAAEAHADRRDVGLLRQRILDAHRLPVKGMLTAGTLLPKTRTSARDVNKHYAGTAPSYLPPHR